MHMDCPFFQLHEYLHWHRSVIHWYLCRVIKLSRNDLIEWGFGWIKIHNAIRGIFILVALWFALDAIVDLCATTASRLQLSGTVATAIGNNFKQPMCECAINFQLNINYHIFGRRHRQWPAWNESLWCWWWWWWWWWWTNRCCHSYTIKFHARPILIDKDVRRRGWITFQLGQKITSGALFSFFVGSSSHVCHRHVLCQTHKSYISILYII